MKLYKSKLLKPRRTSTTNLRRRRTHEEREEQRVSKQAHSQRFIAILFQRSSIHSSTKLKYIGCSNQNHITTNSINKSFKEIESEDNSFVITENCTTQSSIQIAFVKLFYLFDLFRTEKLSRSQILARPVGPLCLSSHSPFKERNLHHLATNSNGL